MPVGAQFAERVAVRPVADSVEPFDEIHVACRLPEQLLQSEVFSDEPLFKLKSVVVQSVRHFRASKDLLHQLVIRDDNWPYRQS